MHIVSACVSVLVLLDICWLTSSSKRLRCNDNRQLYKKQCTSNCERKAESESTNLYCSLDQTTQGVLLADVCCCICSSFCWISELLGLCSMLTPAGRPPAGRRTMRSSLHCKDSPFFIPLWYFHNWLMASVGSMTLCRLFASASAITSALTSWQATDMPLSAWNINSPLTFLRCAQSGSKWFCFALSSPFEVKFFTFEKAACDMCTRKEVILKVKV